MNSFPTKRPQKFLTILAHMILTIVNVLGAVGSFVTGCTFACVMCEMIDALGAIFAWIEFRAEWYFRFAILARKTAWALACVRFNAIDARAIIFAFIFAAIVNVRLAT